MQVKVPNVINAKQWAKITVGSANTSISHTYNLKFPVVTIIKTETGKSCLNHLFYSM